MVRILFVEDNKKLCDATVMQLNRQGYQVDVCHDGEEGFYYLQEGIYDLVILDRMLPRMDGLTLLRKARKKGLTAPVLLLTALGEIEDKVKGLDAGADDYLPKPFDIRELLARVRALARRPGEIEARREVVFGDLLLDPDSLVLQGEKARCTLSKKEAEFLEILMKSEGQAVQRTTLFAKIWGLDAEVEEANLASYALFIRRRLDAVSDKVRLLTVRGIGYRLEGREEC